MKTTLIVGNTYLYIRNSKSAMYDVILYHEALQTYIHGYEE